MATLQKNTAKVGAGLPVEQLTTAHFWSWLNKQGRKGRSIMMGYAGDDFTGMWLNDIGFENVNHWLEILEINGKKYYTSSLFEFSMYTAADSEELPEGTEMTVGDVLKIADDYLPANKPVIEE